MPPRGQWEEVHVHDFLIEDLGRACLMEVMI